MWIRINCGSHWIKKCNVRRGPVCWLCCDLDCRTGESCTVPYNKAIEIGDTVAFKYDNEYGWQSWGKSIKINSEADMTSVINMIQTGLALEEL